ncbi:hypothetical protein J7E70_07920 [Variovorax paradoxus]|nr:hypothetical protein [Variovorax paradoxus]MBT2300390.1 hypothetical protein [Variovorax paradoxus]
MKPRTRTYLLLEIEHSEEIPGLADKAAGRVYTMCGVEGATAILLTTKESFEMARAQVEGGQ